MKLILKGMPFTRFNGFLKVVIEAKVVEEISELEAKEKLEDMDNYSRKIIENGQKYELLKDEVI